MNEVLLTLSRGVPPWSIIDNPRRVKSRWQFGATWIAAPTSAANPDRSNTLTWSTERNMRRSCSSSYENFVPLAPKENRCWKPSNPSADNQHRQRLHLDAWMVFHSGYNCAETAQLWHAVSQWSIKSKRSHGILIGNLVFLEAPLGDLPR